MNFGYCDSMNDELITLGKTFHPGRRVPAKVIRGNEKDLWNQAVNSPEGLRILYVGSGPAMVSIAGIGGAVLPPSLVFLPRHSSIEIQGLSPGREDRLVFFHPLYIHDTLDWDRVFSYNRPNPDAYLLDPFAPEKSFSHRICALEPGLHRTIIGLIDMMERNLLGQEDGYWPCRSRSYLLQVLILCSQARESQGHDGAFIPMADPEIFPIQMEILQNLNSDITVESLASRFGTNRTSLQAKFKSCTGTSVKQYLISLRSKAAEILLRNTALTMGEIALRLGFSDESTFTRAFKNHTGMAPGEVRKAFVYPRYL